MRFVALPPYAPELNPVKHIWDNLREKAFHKRVFESIDGLENHLEGLKQKDMAGYLKHHLEIAGIQEQLFSDEAILATHQASGGLLRRANFLAKGALIAASREKCMVVSAEHVRMASTEIF